MALLATMALLLAARSAAQGGEPCSLNGELKSGACVCDPGWSGAKCSALAVAPSYVLWHQDGKYFFLEPHLHVTAWVALSDSTVESGCVHALPGSHKWGDFEHRDDLGEWNMIKRGQGIPDRFDNETGVPLELKAGEMSLHHTDLVHCSRGNRGADRRIGLGISYIPASVRQTGSPQATALLVRGQAAPGAFGAEQRLDRGMSDAAQQAHAHSGGLFRARQDKGTQMARQATA